ncbi:DUF559 domain-containing protein [soil metagenome]
MRHTAPLLAIAQPQAGLVHRRQLREAGIDRDAIARHVRAGILEHAAPGVLRLTGSLGSWEQRLWRGVLTAQAEALVTFRSAARLHGIGRFGEVVDVSEVGVPPHRSVGAARHRSTMIPAHHRTTVRGIPVTTIERTVFDLASQVSTKRRRRGLPSLNRQQVARALDDAVSGGRPVSGFAAVLSELGGRGRGGTVLMRDLLSTRGEGFVATESELEDLLSEVLERFGIPQPVRQRHVGGTQDRVGRVDFVYDDHALIIEADGRKNHTALLDREADAWRDLELSAAGFRIIRVTWAQLTDEPARFARHLRLLLTSPPRPWVASQ